MCLHLYVNVYVSVCLVICICFVCRKGNFHLYNANYYSIVLYVFYCLIYFEYNFNFVFIFQIGYTSESKYKIMDKSIKERMEILLLKVIDISSFKQQNKSELITLEKRQLIIIHTCWKSRESILSVTDK